MSHGLLSPPKQSLSNSCVTVWFLGGVYHLLPSPSPVDTDQFTVSCLCLADRLLQPNVTIGSEEGISQDRHGRGP